MAKGMTSGGTGLKYKAQLDITEAIKNAQTLKKELIGTGVSLSKSFDTKPLTTYQAEQLKIKQQAIDLAKQKQEQAKAEKSASLVLQDALKQERLAREAINTQIAANRLAQQQANQVAKEQADIQRQIANQKRPTQVSNSQVEIAKYNAGTLGTNGQINTAFTAYLREVKKDFDSGKISAQQYVAELERYSAATTASNSATRTQVTTTQAATKSKQELAQIEAINTLRVNENNAARKVAAKEAINEKGSAEQRKAALERLLGVYARLNAEERNTPYGTRMANTIAQLRVQIKGIEDQTKKMASTSSTSIDQYKASLQRLLAAYTSLNKEQRDTIAGAKLADMIKNLRDQIKGLEDDTKSSKKGIAGIFEYLKDNITSALGAIALLTAAWTTAKAVFSHNVEISDNFTDVQRTAKLSKEEVSEFGKELKKLDTRTDLEHLLDVGFIGGRLSVPKQDLEDFVKQVDELAVVLKKEFPGGAEAVAESLGKIVTIYKITETEGVSLGTALSKVGSTLLELAHSGPVTVKYLQDFTLGVAGTAASAKLSVPIISAYGAVLGESGQIASSAALAITRLVAGLTTKTAKYAAIAQLADATLTVEKFTKIVNTDTKQALDLFFKGLKAGNPVATEFDGRLGSVGINTGKIMNAVKILANNQDKLTDRIRVSSKAFEEGTSVAHNFELANNNLAASVDKLKNSAVNLTTDPNSSLASFFKGIVDGSTYAIKAISDLDDALTKTQLEKDRKLVARADGKQSGKDFFSDLFFGRGSQTSKEVEEARARLKENNSRLLNDEIAARGKASADLLANGKKEIELRKLITGEVVKQKIANDRLANALAFVANPKNTGESVETVSKRINKLREAARQQSALVAQLKTKLPKNTEVYGDGSLVNQDEEGRTPEMMKAEIKALTAVNAKLKVGSKELADGVTKLKALKKELKLALGGKDTEAISAENQYQSALKSRKSLQAEIDALTNKGRAKQLSDDAQELSDVDAKYKKLREKAIAFNNDKKNKGLRVDTGGLLMAQYKEEDALRDKQNAATLKTTIDKEKKYYEDFEKYKSDFGLEKARERYGKLINVDVSYLENLKAKQAALLGDDKAKGGDAGGGEFVEKQQKVLEEATADALQEEQKRTDALLKEFMSYADKRKNLTEQYNSDIKDLEANPGAQAERKKRYERDLKELDAANATQLESYEKLFEGIEKLSTKSALRLVQTARKQLADQIKSGAIVDPEQIKLINALFDTTEQTIRSGAGQALMDLARQVDDIASSIGKIDEAFGKVLGTLGNVLGQVGNIKKGFSDLKAAQGAGSITGQLTAGLGIFGAGLSIFQSIVGFFTKAEQREQQATYARDLQNKQTEAVNKALERQVALLNDVYGTDRIKDYTAAINQARENQAKYASELVGRYQLTGDSKLDEFITKLNNGEKIDPTYAGMVAKAKKASSLLPSDINTLQRLLDEGKLDANTATIVTNLIKAKETAEQLVNNLRAETVGTTLDQIAEDFISTLTDGTQDFGKTFEATMQKSILNGFKGELIRKQLRAFYTQFADLSEGGLTSDEIETLRKSYLTASEKAKKDLEDLSKATGIDLTKDPNGSSSSTGIARAQLTEETGQRIDGIMRAQYDATKLTNVLLTPIGKSIGDMYVIAKSNFDVQVKIEANTFRTANNTDLLNNKLDAIIANTKPTITARGAGI